MSTRTVDVEWLDPTTARIAVAWRDDDGTARQHQLTISWPDPDTARAMIDAAVRQATETTRAPHRLAPGERRHVRRYPTRYGTLYLALLTGPPTWHLPRARWRTRGAHREVMLGWWRAACVIAFDTAERD